MAVPPDDEQRGGNHHGRQQHAEVFLAIAFGAVVAVIGATYNGAHQQRALTRSQNIAAEAGRAAGQALDPTAVGNQ